jgi:hypothetical protein
MVDHHFGTRFDQLFGGIIKNNGERFHCCRGLEMSGMSKADRDRISQLQAEYLANGGQVNRCPIHAQSTGNMRFSYARKAYREADEQRKAEAMDAERQRWNGAGTPIMDPDDYEAASRQQNPVRGA